MATATRQRRPPGGFTLVELVISMVVMTILVAGMSSAILIAMHALPDANDLSALTAAAVEASDQLGADLATATRIVSIAPTSIEIVAPDRGHGAAGPETILYTWSGTAGAPLLRTYNGGVPTTVCENVHAFSLASVLDVGPLTRAPRVLLVTDDTPGSEIAARRALLESWGFPVRQIAASEPDPDILAENAWSDVTYICYEVINDWLALLSKLGDADSWNIARGMITELGPGYSSLGIATGYQILDSKASAITVTDNTHEITASFALGALTIFSSDDWLVQASGSYAPGARQLAERNSKPSLAVVDINGQLVNGVARGRRVKLPWALLPVDIDGLNENGRTLLRRSIVWAAAPVCYTSINVVVRCGGDSSGEIRSTVRLVNLPRVETP